MKERNKNAMHDAMHNEIHRLLALINSAMNAEWNGRCKFCKDIMPYHETVEFARKYMEVNNPNWGEEEDRLWNMATEHIINHIIPLIYGEALD